MAVAQEDKDAVPLELAEATPLKLSEVELVLLTDAVPLSKAE